ncbi:MAG: O-antigen ligase family protein, partial [Nitrococcus sp.]|nr:O-antigen ligase family protein [Nitrococcus sp.]
LCGYLTVVGRSRGVWLALAIVAVLLLLWEFSYLRRQRCRSWRAWAGISMVAAFIMAGTAAAWPIVEKRLSREIPMLEHLMEGEFGAIAATGSIRARPQMWRFGLNKTLQRPWLGWGAGGSDYLLGHSGNAELIRHEDFHSAAVDLPARLGIPATLTFGLLCLSLLWIPLRARDANRHVVQTLVALLLLHLLTQATNFRMLNTDWRFCWLLIAGLCAGYALRRRTRASHHRAASRR